MAFSSSSSSPSCEINVTPLIDVLLVLLILFMVIGPATPLGLDSQVPQGRPAASPALPPVVLRVLAGEKSEPARYEVSAEPIAPGALPGRLRALFAVRQDRTIFLEADRSLSYGEVAEAVSAARAAGAGAVVVSGLHG